MAITAHSAQWADLPWLGSAADRLGDGEAASVFVISGELRNETASAIPHVALRFELLDAKGGVVASETGYNRRAEHLRPVDSPVPAKSDPVTVSPIPAHGTDAFRMIFLADEIPAFRTYRVEVVKRDPVP